MKSLKEQYKDTFDNIRIDNNIVNNNLYKIITKEKNKRFIIGNKKKLFNSLFVILLITASLVGVTAYVGQGDMFKVDNTKIKVTTFKTEKNFSDDTFYDNERISMRDFEEKAKVKLLKTNKEGIDLKLFVNKKDNYINSIYAWYEFDNNGWYSESNYNIFAFRAYLKFNDSDIEFDCIYDNCQKNIDKLQLNDGTEVLIMTDDSLSCIVKFVRNNVYYTFNYNEFRLMDKLSKPDSKKQVYNNLLDFIEKLNY